MLNRRLIICLLTVFYTLTNAAQTYRGCVVDASSKPLVGISVVLCDKDHRPSGFTRSDENGKFTVSAQADRKVTEIVFMMMGFETKTIDISHYTNGQKTILAEKSFTLREVKVKPTRIRRNGDTLTYSVATFKEKQDRSIADVIARMPGMEVKGNGSIEYQGKPINKFYVEGMDLLGGQYSQASENLSADHVKSVQVMENHQPVKVLRQVNFSDQAALNIVLKDNARNVWNGIADISAGLPLQGNAELLRDCRVVEMLFARKMQSISMYKCNNTGKDIQHELRDFGDRETLVPIEGGILDNIHLTAPSLEERRSLFNDTHIGATNWLFKTPSGNDLRIQLSALYDKSKQNQRSETMYTDVDNSKLITEDQEAASYRSEYTGQLMYRVNNAHIYLTNNLKGYADFNRSEGTSLFNGTQTDEYVRPRKRHLSDKFALVRKLGDNNSLSASSELNYNDLPATILSYDGREQQIDLSTLYWKTSASFRHQLMGFYVTYTAGFNMSNQKLNVDSAREEYRERRLFLTPSISYQHNGWRVNASIPFLYIYRSANQQNRGSLVAEPSVFMSYDMTPVLSMSATYTYTDEPNDIKSISNIPYYTSYITMRQGAGLLDDVKGHHTRVGLQYKDIMLGLFANASFGYNSLRNMRLYQSTLVNGIYTTKASEKTSATDTYTLKGSVKESLGAHGFTVGLNCSYSWSNYDMLINDVVNSCRFRDLEIGLRYSYRPWSILSFDGNSSYAYVRQTEATGSFYHQLNTFLTPGHWQIEWVNECYHSNDRSVSFNFFSDLSVSYRTGTYELGIYGTNIFGNRSYERRMVTTNMASYTINRIRQREIMLKLSINI